MTDSVLPTDSARRDGLLIPRTTGVGAVVRWRDTFVFELQAASKWTADANGTLQIGVACIGGGILPGESIELALQRESIEEIGTGLVLHRPVRQYHIDGAGTVTMVVPRDSAGPEPLLCWRGVAPGFEDCRVCAFAATALSRPVPLDVGGLVYADLGSLLGALRRRCPIKVARAYGIRTETTESLPEDAVLVSAGTVDALHRIESSYGALLGEIRDACVQNYDR